MFTPAINSSGGPFRSTRLRAPSHLPPGRFSLVSPHLAHVQQTLVVDAQRQTGGAGQETKDESKNVRRRETIFGPDVGEDDEPGWTKPDEDAKVDVNVVKGWVERAKSEEGLHATTTLQALVNLKRPSLLLQQLGAEAAHVEGEDIVQGDIIPATGSRPTSTVPTPPLHTLKFNYDATTPLVNISLSIHPTPPVPEPAIEGKEVPSIVEEEPRVVYSGVHGGGFDQSFTLPAEHAIDLSSAITPIAAQSDVSTMALGNDANRESQSEDDNRSSLEQAMGNLRVAGPTQPDLATVPESTTPAPEPAVERRPRRFGIFPRRNRDADPEVGEIEMQNRQGEENGEKKDEEKEPERGMRVLIRIEAVGPEGQALKRPNAQLTHILVTGMWVADAGSPTGPAQAGKQVWIVKVVRREAVIGAHTFLLKEIYGLSSSTQTQQPTSYPPVPDTGADPYASTPNECIVCLTSPRDVVLLPCRHLVVCRECAVGMVEFGAGGKVARREEGAEGDVTATATDVAAGAADRAAPATRASGTQVAGGNTAAGRERRKRKAKGWYCPVCRQPYTSLLRLALPSSAKPVYTHDETHHASRAPSVRSMHSTHTLRRPPSIAPTLPDGAEMMLNRLRPEGADEDVSDHDHDSDHEREVEPERPQFVLGPGFDDEDTKQQVEHREVADASESTLAEQTSEARRQSQDGKGWKEAA